MDYKEVLEHVDIAEYVSQYVELEEKNGELWGLSPFKEENTPSFSVNVEKQRFFDYSSNESGDTIDFIKAYNNVGFRGALNILMGFLGIKDDEDYHKRPSILNEIKKYTPKEKKAKKSEGRKILDSDCMDFYGYNKKKMKTWLDAGMTEKVLKDHKVKYNFRDDSLVFPYYDSYGNIVSICSRTLCGRAPKYLPYNKFGGVDFMYWEYQSRSYILEQNEIVILEGAKSVMVAEAYGYLNCVATLTSHLNSEQLKLLIGLNVPVVFAYDKGVDIRADKNIQKLMKFTKVQCITDKWNMLKEKDSPIDQGKDVWDFLYSKKYTV